MMGVQIYIGDARQSAIEQPQDSKHHVVQKTETAGAVASSVMRAAGEMVDDPALLEQKGRRLQRTAAGRGGPPKHLWKDRIAIDPEIEAPPDLRRARCVRSASIKAST
jgi:hypothetical protein